MLTIRLSRHGKKHDPVYRIVVAEKHRHVSKQYKEILGFYNPKTKDFSIKEDRLKYYLDLNIETSETLKSLFKKHTTLIK